jgi:hypothetical protein
MGRKRIKTRGNERGHVSACADTMCIRVDRCMLYVGT